MSYLRQIMQRLHDRSSQRPPAEPADPPARLEEHLRIYGERLAACSNAMLDYEQVWLEQHLETLELCAREPTMRQSAGGAERVELLLQESRRFRELLESRRRERGLATAGMRAAVMAGEHAWELSDPALRRAWGFPNDPPTGPGA